MIRFIYVAGAYTAPTPAQVEANVAAAIDAGARLIAAGLCPFIPHLSHYVRLFPYETWMALDFAWIERCDALLRLPGASRGADREADHARALGLTIFNDIDLLLAATERAP